MAQGTGAIKAALWSFLLLALASWVLSIIGLAGLQRQCYFQPPLQQVEQGGGTSTGGEGSLFGSDLPFVGIRGLNRSYGCQRFYSYYWWSIAFEIVTLLGLLVLSCVGLLAASGLSWLAWLVVLSALFIQGSDTFLAIADLGHNVDLFGETLRYARLAAAGWVLTSLCNLAITFILGWRPRKLMSGGAGAMKY